VDEFGVWVNGKDNNPEDAFFLNITWSKFVPNQQDQDLF
jgi:hypothetical protein